MSSLTYLLRGLPTDLTPQEAAHLRLALPQDLQEPSPLLLRHRSPTSSLLLIQPSPSRSLNSNNPALPRTPLRPALHQIFPRRGARL